MEYNSYYPVQNNQWYNNSQTYRKSAYRKARRFTHSPQYPRALLIIDGAYFEQGTISFFKNQFSIDLFSCDSPSTLISSFISMIEEYTDCVCDQRYFVSALFDENMGTKKIRENQQELVDVLQNDCQFNIDIREFKQMKVYCPNKN